MSVQLKKGVLEMVVLSKIENTDTYGYDIYQEINNSIFSNTSCYIDLDQILNNSKNQYFYIDECSFLKFY